MQNPILESNKTPADTRGLPDIITGSTLYSALLADSELLNEIISLRSVVLSLAETTGRTVSTFTDHTIRHMDALWAVTDHVLTQHEIAAMNPAEIFLLTAGFYLHDVGMAYAATEESIRRIKETQVYKGAIASVSADRRDAPDTIARAIALAVRTLHADAAIELSTKEIPGTNNRYLFERLSFREQWADICGRIASSHHWDLTKLEDEFGRQSVAPLPGNRSGDFLYVACCLRIIDFAHINRDRAPPLDRALRGTIENESLIHWLAQENINGPIRSDDELKYNSARPISDVDAWWLYYGMLNGLDKEIRLVKRLLDYRKEGLKRISLVGVHGANSPEDAAAMIPTGGFLPMEVDLHTGSIDRLVELLAGETLYGPNPMAAVRELIQNARDAVMLKAESASTDIERSALSLPISISLTSNPPTLEVIDYGIGMTKKVITDYLIAIASSYWTKQFAYDFPEIASRGFKNAGKFGIGFLSVFMLGAEVTVETNRAAGERYKLSLRGAGRRGELRQTASIGGSGTAVRIKLKTEALHALESLDTLIPVYAPTLPHNLSITVDGKKHDVLAGWLKTLSADDFVKWIEEALEVLRTRISPRADSGHFSLRRVRVKFLSSQYSFSSSDKEIEWPCGVPEYHRDNNRLVVSFAGTSLLCLRGLTVQSVGTPGFAGVIDLDSAVLDVSRNRANSADISGILQEARQAVIPQIIKNLEHLSKNDLLTDKIDLISKCVKLYGNEILSSPDVLWINLISKPGNLELISRKKLFDSLVGTKSVFVAFNTGPWTAMKTWSKLDPVSTGQEIAVLLDGAGQQTPSYRASHEDKAVGVFADLWESWNESSLFQALISTIAEAWQIAQEDLIGQDGWTHERETIYGRFMRP